jgi:hypothetical protein
MCLGAGVQLERGGSLPMTPRWCTRSRQQSRAPPDASDPAITTAASDPVAYFPVMKWLGSKLHATAVELAFTKEGDTK